MTSLNLKRLCLLLAACLMLAPSVGLAGQQGVLLVNREHPLPRDYACRELVKPYEHKRQFQLSNVHIQLEREVFEAANRMFRQARQDGVSRFTITSGYRSWATQERLYAKGANANAAAPGTSEHQTGLAFDVTTRRERGGFETSKQYEWLSQHCWEYGFILRYPQGKEHITGFAFEPWHYRYVGEEIAREIRDRGCTLEEYCQAMEAAAAAPQAHNNTP